MNDISQVISLLKRHTKIIGNQFIISGYQHQSIWSSGVLEEVSYLLLIAYVNLMQSDGMDTHKRVLIDKVVDEWAGIITGILNHQNTPQSKMMIKQRLNEKSIKYTPIIDQMLGERLDNNPDDEVFYKYELYELFIEEIKDNFNTRFCQRPEDGLAGAMDFINLSEDNNIICQEVFDERSVVMLSLKYDDVDEINEHDKIAITKNQNKKDIRKRALVIRDGVVNFLTECAYQVTQKGGNSKENFYDNDDIQDEDGKNKGSQLGLFFMPAIMTSLLSKLLFSAGIIFGFIATLLTFGVCSGCYSYTYEKVQSNKFIKEFFAILFGIFGCILWVVFLFFIADIFDYKQSSHNVKSNTTSQSVLNDQNTQNVNISPNNIQTANTNNEPQLNPQFVLAEAKNRYDDAVANINAVWNSLHPSTQDFLRDEQRAINKQREADCTAYGNAQSSDKDLAKAYRYLCEVLQLNERAEYLKTQLNTVVTPPEPKNVGPAYYQNQQSSQNGYHLNDLINDTVKKSLLFLDRDSASYDGYSHKLESQDITYADVNNDGIKDAVVALRYCEVANCHMTTKSSELAVYLGVGNNQYLYGDIRTLGIDLSIRVAHDGVINTQSKYYSEHEDPACCPSMVINNSFVFNHSKLNEIY